MKLFEDKTKKTIEDKLTELREAARDERNEDYSTLIDLYNNDQEAELFNTIENQFKYDVEELQQQPRWLNIIAPIIKANSSVFEYGVTYTFQGSSEKLASEVWDRFAKKEMLDQHLDHLNKMTNLLKTMMVRLSWVDDAVALDLIYPQDIRVVQKTLRQQEAEAIIMEYIEGSDSIGTPELYLFYYDAESAFVTDNSGNMLEDPNNPKKINPYGLIPFIKSVSKVGSRKFFAEPDEGMINTQNDINIKLTQLNNIIKYQSYNYTVFLGWDGESKIILSPSRPVKMTSSAIGSEPDVKQLTNTNENMIRLWTQIKEDMQLYARLSGVPVSRFSIDNISRESGIKIKIDDTPIIKERTRQMPYYTRVLQEMWTVFKAIYNVEASGAKISDDTEMTVEFNNSEEYDSESEKIQRRTYEKENGLKNSIDHIIEDNPDIEYEEATKRYYFNLELLAKEKQAQQGFASADKNTDGGL